MSKTFALLRLWPLLLAGGLSIAGGSLSLAADAPASTPAPAAPPDEVRSFQIGSYTEIKLDGAEIQASRLKVGMQAYVTADSFQSGYAGKIDAHVPAHQPPADPNIKIAFKIPDTDKQWVVTAVTPNSISVTFKKNDW